MTVPERQETDLQALSEVCSIGMRHAATALSQLMGKPVRIDIPRLIALDPASLAQSLDAREVTCLHLQILGKVRGSIVILLHEENTRRILQILLGKLPAAGQPLSDLEISTLKEIGNILASACLNALGGSLKMSLLPSVPNLERGEASGVLAQALGHPPAGEAILVVDAMFSIGDTPCSGSIFLIPATASLEAILASLATS